MKESNLKKNKEPSLYVNEIFYSIQGESTKTGLPTVFIRLTGCPLRCHYCDTSYAFYNGEKMSIDWIIDAVNRYKTRHVTVTGGEPLAQKNCALLLTHLCEQHFHVSLETSGTIEPRHIDQRVMKVVDIKTPGSGESEKNKLAILDQMKGQDQIKFVICDRNDYDWAKKKVDEHHLSDRCEILFSAAYKQLELKRLAEWILEDRLPVRLQPQIHKYLWGDAPAH